VVNKSFVSLVSFELPADHSVRSSQRIVLFLGFFELPADHSIKSSHCYAMLAASAIFSMRAASAVITLCVVVQSLVLRPRPYLSFHYSASLLHPPSHCLPSPPFDKLRLQLCQVAATRQKVSDHIGGWNGKSVNGKETDFVPIEGRIRNVFAHTGYDVLEVCRMWR